MELPQRLVARLVQASGKGKLETLLRDAKKAKGLTSKQITVSGSSEDLEKAAWSAVTDGHITVQELAALVDEVEECGAQHLYLYTLTDLGVTALADKQLKKLPLVPQSPTEAFYADQPSARRTYHVLRGNNVFLKQIYTAHYWERDEKRSSSSPTERIDVRVIKARRGVTSSASI